MIPEMETSFKLANLCYIMIFPGGSRPEVLCGSPSVPSAAKHASRLNQVNHKCPFSLIFFFLNVLKSI